MDNGISTTLCIIHILIFFSQIWAKEWALYTAKYGTSKILWFNLHKYTDKKTNWQDWKIKLFSYKKVK